MALYARAQRQPGDVKYHTTLLVIPKGADPSSEEKTATRYHVTNPIKNGRQVWEFDPNGEPLENILRQVPVVNDDPTWRCRHWVWSTLDVLAEAGVISPLPATPEAIWNTGVEFADANPVDPTTGIIPTCTTDGLPTRSALEGA